MQLSDIIIQRIKNEGPVSFHDFMEMCLYYPGLGYYTSAQDKIGKNGDFYTSSNLCEIMGIMIGNQLEEMWCITGKKDFTIVEYGAGTGRLCHDILDYLAYNDEFYSRLTYCIIEKSSFMREKEKDHLPEKVRWADSIRHLSPITGCVISNEVVDNFSVHRVVMKEELMEVYVDYKDGFIEVLRPAKKVLVNYLEQLDVSLPENFKTEINLEAVEWIQEIATCLKRGYMLTIDYAYLSEELYRNCRNEGTLLCYHKHAVNDQLYYHIDKQDITSHVNFSALSHWGKKNGLIASGYINQANFFISLGWEDHLIKLLQKQRDSYLSFKQYAFLKYIFLMDIGQKFKVLIQQKDARHYTSLSSEKIYR